jgi:hypothetical protein
MTISIPVSRWRREIRRSSACQSWMWDSASTPARSRPASRTTSHARGSRLPPTTTSVRQGIVECTRGRNRLRSRTCPISRSAVPLANVRTERSSPTIDARREARSIERFGTRPCSIRLRCECEIPAAAATRSWLRPERRRASRRSRPRSTTIRCARSAPMSRARRVTAIEAVWRHRLHSQFTEAGSAASTTMPCASGGQPDHRITERRPACPQGGPSAHRRRGFRSGCTRRGQLGDGWTCQPSIRPLDEQRARG